MSTSALVFNGPYNNAVARDDRLPRGNAPFTICTWVNTRTAGSDPLVSWGTFTPGRYASLYFNGGYGTAGFDNGTGDYLDRSLRINDGTWRLFMVSWDGRVIRLFRDNPTLERGSAPCVVDILPNGEMSCGHLKGNNAYLYGMIADARIYDHALSLEERLPIWNGGTGDVDYAGPGILRHYKCVEGQGTRVADAAGGYDLTLYDGVSWAPTGITPPPPVAQISRIEAGPSGELLKVEVERIADKAKVGITRIPAAPTIRINGGHPITLTNPLLPRSGNWLMWFLNPPAVRAVVDDGDPGCSLAGTGWATSVPDVSYKISCGGVHRTSTDGGASATFTFSNLVPGRYQAYRTELPVVAGATSRAIYTISAGDQVADVTHDLTRPYAYDDVDLRYRWTKLGGPVTVSGTTAAIKVSNGGPAGSKLVVDAVRMVQILPPAIVPGDVVTFSAESGWAATATADITGGSELPVVLATREQWLPYDPIPSPRRMKMGANIQGQTTYGSSRFYANLMRSSNPWGGANGLVTVKTDEYGELVSIEGGVGKASAALTSSAQNGIDDMGYILARAGVYVVKYRVVGGSPGVNLFDAGNAGTLFRNVKQCPDEGGKKVFTVEVDLSQRGLRTNAVFLGISCYAYPGPTDVVREIEVYPPHVPQVARGDPYNWPYMTDPFMYNRFKGKNFQSARFLTTIGTNGSNVVKWSDFQSPRNVTIMRSTYDIRAEVVKANPTRSPNNGSNYAYVELVTRVPHGITTGQTGSLRFRGNTVFPDTKGGTVNLATNGMPMFVVTGPSTFNVAFECTGGNYKDGADMVAIDTSHDVDGSVSIEVALLDHPIQDVVTWCNETGTPMWVNIPHALVDDGVRQLARYIAANLNRSLPCYVELSNEVWNIGPSFRQTGYFYTIGSQRGLDYRAAYAQRCGEVFAIFKEEFNARGRSSDAKAVIGTQLGWAAVSLMAVEYMKGDPAKGRARIPFDFLAVAPYQWNGTDWAMDEPSANAAYDRASIRGLIDLAHIAALHDPYPGYVADHRAALDAAGYKDVKILTYEGLSENLCPQSADGYQRVRRAQAVSLHPEWLYGGLSYLQAYERVGCVLFNRFFDAGDDGFSSGICWGNIHLVGQVPGRATNGENANPWAQDKIVSVQAQTIEEWAALSVSEAGYQAPGTRRRGVVLV